MQDFIDAVLFGFKEIRRSETVRFAMLSGIVVSMVWIGIGFYFWDAIIGMSSSILSMLPFSMLRSNGAWMLSSFLWLQLVIVTFAVVFAFLGNLIIEKVNKDRYASLSLFIGIASALFWSIVWFFEGDFIYAQLLKLFTWLPFETIEKAIAYLIGFYLIYTAIIVTLIFVTSMLSKHFLLQVKERHFPYDTMYDDTNFATIKKTLRDSLLFVVASLLSFPLLFVPVLNFFILVALWLWLMKDTLVSDTAAFVFGDMEAVDLKKYKAAIWGFSFIGSLFNFIPVFNVFGPYFTQLAMFYYFVEKRELS